jgi:carotenoid 1,2-hydratase
VAAGPVANFSAALDDGGRHRWGPIAPCARVEVELEQPGLRWSGHAYLDSNEGDEPIDRPFAEWDWSRATLRDGSTAVIYDVRRSKAPSALIAQRFRPTAAPAPSSRRRASPAAHAWRIGRTMRTEPARRRACCRRWRTRRSTCARCSNRGCSASA